MLEAEPSTAPVTVEGTTSAGVTEHEKEPSEIAQVTSDVKPKAADPDVAMTSVV